MTLSPFLQPIVIAFDSTPNDSNWNSNADFNGDGIVNIAGMAIAAINYGTAVIQSETRRGLLCSQEKEATSITKIAVFVREMSDLLNIQEYHIPD